MKNTHLIVVSLLWLVVLVLTVMSYERQIRIVFGLYDNLVEHTRNLRADAKRTNDELICMRMIFDNYTPNDEIIEECVSN